MIALAQPLASTEFVDVIRYLSRDEKPSADGPVMADLEGPRFQILAQNSVGDHFGTPLYNPFGRWKLASMKDIAQSN